MSIDADFAVCRDICEAHGKTYALATRLLPPARRRAVWALYAWARVVDDYVDVDEHGCAGPIADARAAAEGIDRLRAGLAEALADGSPTGSPDAAAPAGAAIARLSGVEASVVRATGRTVRDLGIDHGLLDDFLDSMLMDLPGSPTQVTTYRTWAELDRYMWGSACVIGLEMLPVLGLRRGADGAAAARHAAELGRAFQVTNFIRDVAEDLDRGRIYLPLDEWEAFGVDEERLRRCRARGEADDAVKAAVAHFISVNRAMYRDADPGIPMLAQPGSRAIRTARVLYAGILDEVERADHDVFARRAVVPDRRRIAVAAPNAVAGMVGWTGASTADAVRRRAAARRAASRRAGADRRAITGRRARSNRRAIAQSPAPAVAAGARTKDKH